MIQRQIQSETPVEPAFRDFYNFPFDPFQIEAMGHIRDGRSVMVAAPTSSGKTVVAEYALWRALRAGTRAIYTTPIKALSNQKRRDLEDLFPGRVGLLTGDRSENADAPIVVMTTEVLRNMLVEDPAALDQVSVVVFDEVHYLADQDRGTVWEESIITCPPHVRLVCLSATIANAREIADWIGVTHRDIALMRHDERPVPLEHYAFARHGLHLIRDAQGQRRIRLPHARRDERAHPADVVQAMANADLLPAIWFAFSRRAVEEAAEACVVTAPRRTPEQVERIESAIAWTLDALPPEDRRLPQLSMLIRLLRQGVGFHHAGLLPPLKELVERLFTAGLLSVVCATDTLAVGINMPARTVVISSMSRPFGGLLSPNDFSQLTGRSGRRGIDQRGAVILLPSRYYDFEDAYAQITGPLEPVLSSFRLRYSTLLSAMEGSEDRLGELVRLSLRQYQMKANARRAEAQLVDIRRSLAEAGFDTDVQMREYLQLQSDLSQAEKEQKRARNARARSPKSGQAIRRLERAREARQTLVTMLRSHPRHEKAAAAERDHPEQVALLRRAARLETVVREAQEESDQQATETAEAVRTALTRLGYMNEHGMTPKARGLREMVAASGIVLSEMYHRGVFDKLEPAELAEVISWFASDANRRRDNSYELPRPLSRVRRQALSTFRSVASVEDSVGIDLAQGPSDWFYGVALAWCRGESIARITSRIQLGEGDVVGMLNKTIDLMDQFDGMLRQSGDRKLMAVTAEARRLLVRGLVAMVRSDDGVGYQTMAVLPTVTIPAL